MSISIVFTLLIVVIAAISGISIYVIREKDQDLKFALNIAKDAIKERDEYKKLYFQEKLKHKS